MLSSVLSQAAGVEGCSERPYDTEQRSHQLPFMIPAVTSAENVGEVQKRARLSANNILQPAALPRTLLTLKVWPQFHRKAKRTHTHTYAHVHTLWPVLRCCLCLCVPPLCSNGLLLLCCKSFFVVCCSSFLRKGEKGGGITCAVCSVMRQYVKLFI